MTAQPALDLKDLGLDRGGHILVLRALRELGPGLPLTIAGTHPDLALQLSVLAREGGHSVTENTGRSASEGRSFTLVAGPALDARSRGAARAGSAAHSREHRGVSDRADERWGVAARGALVEAGAPRWDFSLDRAEVVWTDDAKKLYAQAAAAQWDPETAIPWGAAITHPRAVEDAVVQVMTYLVENENAALLVPARFLGRIHPHYREVVQLMAIQIADEARHVEVFTRRALLRSSEMAL